MKLKLTFLCLGGLSLAAASWVFLYDAEQTEPVAHASDCRRVYENQSVDQKTRNQAMICLRRCTTAVYDPQKMTELLCRKSYQDFKSLKLSDASALDKVEDA